ncbi:MAG: AN1-type zinc finger domain-containing protein [Candidatus Thorarchaeota archaeon]
MQKCNFCKKLIGGFPYICGFCKMKFCGEHRLPENHACSFDIYSNNEEIIYQDALKMYNEEIQVAKVYDLTISGKLNKVDAIKILENILEFNSNYEERIAALYAFKVLDLRNKESFYILENCILTEEDPLIRSIAKNVVIDLFPEKSRKLFEQKESNKF